MKLVIILLIILLVYYYLKVYKKKQDTPSNYNPGEIGKTIIVKKKENPSKINMEAEETEFEEIKN